MKRAIISKNGQVTHQADMEEADLLAWIDRHESMESFGQPEVWEDQQILVSAAVLSQEGEILVPAVYETQSVKVQDSDYSIEIQDATQSQDEINAEAKAYLASTDWYVTRFVEIGIAIPSQITSARAAARASIV